MDKNPRVLIFDIESTNLSANFGYIICIHYKWLNEKKVHKISIDQFPRFKENCTDDSMVLAEFAKVYAQAGIVVAHYGEKFDVPMIKTRLLMGCGRILPNVRLIDTWRLSKRHLKLNSNRLATLIESLGVKHKKTPLSGPTWIRAMAGHKKSIQYVNEHCKHDVLALEAAYKKLILFEAHRDLKSHPCGTDGLRKNGFYYAEKCTFQRYFCTKCGAWLKGEKK